MVNLLNLWLSRIPDDVQQDLDVTWGLLSPEQTQTQVSSDFTSDELDLARKMQEAGKTKQDFLDSIDEYREFRDQEDIGEPKIEKTPEEIEREQGLGWFVTETAEALWQRVEKLWDIKQRFDARIIENQQNIQQAIKEKWALAWLKESFIGQFKNIWTAFQVVWQGAWAITDTVWEGLENSVQLFTPEVVEQGVEWAIKDIVGTETVQSIAESYNQFKERNPETAGNLEAAINIAELIPWVKAVTKAVKAPIKVPTKKSIELEKEAAQRVEEFIKPTKITTKEITKRITPWIIERLKTGELKAVDREILQKQAKEQIDVVWKDISDFIAAGKVKWEIRLDSLVDTLAKADDKLRIDWVLAPGNEAASNFINKQLNFLEVLETKFGKNLPTDRQVELRRLYDVVFDKRVTRDKITTFQDDLQVKLADNLRRELAKNNPELDALNKDFTFYKGLDTVLEDTIQRTTGQAPVWLITAIQAWQQGWLWAAIWATAWVTDRKSVV